MTRPVRKTLEILVKTLGIPMKGIPMKGTPVTEIPLKGTQVVKTLKAMAPLQVKKSNQSQYVWYKCTLFNANPSNRFQYGVDCNPGVGARQGQGRRIYWPASIRKLYREAKAQWLRTKRALRNAAKNVMGIRRNLHRARTAEHITAEHITAEHITVETAAQIVSVEQVPRRNAAQPRKSNYNHLTQPRKSNGQFAKKRK
ncbi:MAG: hypothetical protein L6R40_008725 [Gallowayella cf. fulva]|nr:MAG: hypothetical protein L6R40_008725 [Xanthomendoza cf. fulva]